MLLYDLKTKYLCRLAHLHEGVKPKILHGSIKSSNILLDHHWNPKISDFGLIKVLSPEWSNFVMGTMGLVSLTKFSNYLNSLNISTL